MAQQEVREDVVAVLVVSGKVRLEAFKELASAEHRDLARSNRSSENALRELRTQNAEPENANMHNA
eukprot:1883830-Lingulodinium_polyedra.AAC.1